MGGLRGPDVNPERPQLSNIADHSAARSIIRCRRSVLLAHGTCSFVAARGVYTSSYTPGNKRVKKVKNTVRVVSRTLCIHSASLRAGLGLRRTLERSQIRGSIWAQWRWTFKNGRCVGLGKGKTDVLCRPSSSHWLYSCAASPGFSWRKNKIALLTQYFIRRKVLAVFNWIAR